MLTLKQRRLPGAVAICLLALVWSSGAALDPISGYPLTGKFSLSVDGGGSNDPYTIQVNKPSADATVHQAFFLAAATFERTLGTSDISLEGTPITWDLHVVNDFNNNYLADVTDLLSTDLNAASAGTLSVDVTENTDSETIDGTILVVVWEDPALLESRTIMLMFGGLDSSGDTLNITLGTSIPFNGKADMGLGIAHSSQGNSQVTTVYVNESLITSSAGGQDDGETVDGALITVGGIGDSNSNPASPTAGPGNNFRYDDELYSLLPFISDTTTALSIKTENPTLDDNVFFSHFVFSGSAVVGEGIVLSPETAKSAFGTSHSVTATVVNTDGEPVEGVPVVFEITSGPNSGQASTPLLTNSSGQAVWLYTDGASVSGTDIIQANFIGEGETQITSITVSNTWLEVVSIDEQSFDLCQQWNLIYLRLDPAVANPELHFGADSFVYKLTKVKAAGSEFSFTYTFELVTGPGSLVGGKAYWVYVPSARLVTIDGVAASATTELLSKAWNMFGSHGTRPLPATSALLRLLYWDCEVQEYAEPEIDSQGRYILEDGRGYFGFASRAINILIQD